MRLLSGTFASQKIPDCPYTKIAVSNHERIIFYHLGLNNVLFDNKNHHLYFSDLDNPPVLPLLKQLCRAQQQQIALELLFMDNNHYFFAGYRTFLSESLAKPVLVALRLKGVNIQQHWNEANVNNTRSPWFPASQE